MKPKEIRGGKGFPISSKMSMGMPSKSVDGGAQNPYTNKRKELGNTDVMQSFAGTPGNPGMNPVEEASQEGK